MKPGSESFGINGNEIKNTEASFKANLDQIIRFREDRKGVLDSGLKESLKQMDTQQAIDYLSLMDIRDDILDRWENDKGPLDLWLREKIDSMHPQEAIDYLTEMINKNTQDNIKYLRDIMSKNN